jgi:hypothetical protein
VLIKRVGRDIYHDGRANGKERESVAVFTGHIVSQKMSGL